MHATEQSSGAVFVEVPLKEHNQSATEVASFTHSQVPHMSSSVVHVPQTMPEYSSKKTIDKREINCGKIFLRWWLVVVGYAVLLFGLITFIVVVSLQTPMPTWQRVVYIVLASVLNLAVFGCYVVTMCTPAGMASDEWKVPEEYYICHETGPILGIKDEAVKLVPYDVHMRDKNGSVRFCRTCKSVRPDRSYHCHMCGGCSLRFDHHCPWMGQCIGHGNHKLFYLFTFYGVLLAIFYVAATIPPAVQYFQGTISEDTYIVVLDMVILIITAFFGVGFVGTLFVSHTYYILVNKTTYERLRPQATKYSDVPRNAPIFHTGDMYANWCSVMGDNPWLWLVPVPATLPNNGCEYSINPQLVGKASQHDV